MSYIPSPPEAPARDRSGLPISLALLTAVVVLAGAAVAGFFVIRRDKQNE